MKCPSCGRTLDSDQSSCSGCGAKAITGIPASEAAMPPGCWKLQFRIFVGLGLVLVLLLTVLVVVPAIKERRRKSIEYEHWLALGKCQFQLRAIALACQEHNETKGSYPPSLRDLYESGKAVSPADFACPVTHDVARMPDGKPPWTEFAGQVSYEYRPPPSSANHRYVITWDRAPHPDGMRCVVRKDGLCKVLTEAEFQEAKRSGL